MVRIFTDELLHGRKRFFNVDAADLLQHADMVVPRNGSLRDAYLAPGATRIKNR